MILFSGPILFGALCAYAVLSLISMATMSIGAGLVGGAMLLHFRGPGGIWRAWRRARSASRWARRLAGVSLALFAALLASLVVARIAPLGFGGRFVRVDWLTDLPKAWYLAWPFLLWISLRELSEVQRQRVFWVWLAAFGVLSLVGIQEFFTCWPRSQMIPIAGRQAEHCHATIFLGHHLSVASIWVFPLFAAMDAALHRARAPRARWFWAAVALLGGVTLFMTYSRTLWGALPVGLAIWVVWNLPRRRAMQVLGVSALLLAFAASQGPIRDRVFSHLGIGERQDLWKANFEFLRLRPLTGSGWHHNQELSGFYLLDQHPGTRVFSGHAHNNFIEMLGGTGLLGAAAWLAWCGVVFAIAWAAARVSPPRGFARGLVCAWVVFQINGLTQVNFWEAKVLHQIMWTVAWSLGW